MQHKLIYCMIQASWLVWGRRITSREIVPAGRRLSTQSRPCLIVQKGECGPAATPRQTFSRSARQREQEAKCGAYLIPILTR